MNTPINTTLGSNADVHMSRSRWLCLVAVAICAGLFATGCSTKPTAASILKEEAKLAEAREDLEKARVKRQNESMEKFMDKTPSWVIAPPRSDGENVYAVGEAQSKRLDLARQKARLLAEFGLAKQYRQALSGSERLFQSDGVSGTSTERYTVLIDKLVDRVPLVGHVLVKQETIVVDGTYHTYMLYKLSLADMQRILAKQREENVDRSIDRQFEDLDQRLRQYREDMKKSPPTDAASRPPANEPPGGSPAPAGALPEVREIRITPAGRSES
jgi:hypothetical protein